MVFRENAAWCFKVPVGAGKYAFAGRRCLVLLTTASLGYVRCFLRLRKGTYFVFFVHRWIDEGTIFFAATELRRSGLRPGWVVLPWYDEGM